VCSSAEPDNNALEPTANARLCEEGSDRASPAAQRVVVRQRKRDIVKTLAFAIGLLIAAVGTVGILAPSGLVWIANHSVAPVELYVIAAVRVAFGVLLISVAPASRAPKTLRVVGLIPLVAAIATPFVGVDRAPAIIEWWSQQGSGLVRLSAVFLLALGGFVAYACAPVRGAA
jgi:hypothetical protein